ncbi:hypothetical protein OL242_001630, partial [Rodentibacter heylii]|nr:hypothetical protein [Rodentibacter heylii]
IAMIAAAQRFRSGHYQQQGSYRQQEQHRTESLPSLSVSSDCCWDWTASRTGSRFSEPVRVGSNFGRSTESPRG